MNAASQIQSAVATAQPSRPFERIQIAADRAESLASSIRSFLGRAASYDDAERAVDPHSPSYTSQIERLHFALNGIEGAVAELHSLG